MGFAAGELHDQQSALPLDPAPCVALAGGKCRTSGHFRDDKAGSQRLDLTPERRVGNPGHGGEKDRIPHRERPDCEFPRVFRR
jgi:hypothetical protein